MKKILLFLMVFVLTFSLIACSTGSNEEETKVDATPTTTETVSAEQAEADKKAAEEATAKAVAEAEAAKEASLKAAAEKEAAEKALAEAKTAQEKAAAEKALADAAATAKAAQEAAVKAASEKAAKEAAAKAAAEAANATSEKKLNLAVNLGVTWWGGQARHDATLKAIEIYKKRNPGATFEPTYMDFTTYLVKVSTLAAAKALPDIVKTDLNYLADYASKGMLADISTGINLSEIDQSLAKTGTINGKLYGIPIGLNMQGMFYNKEELQKLGVTMPEKGLTWDELLSVARVLKPKLGNGKYVMSDASYTGMGGQVLDYEKYQLSQGKGFLVKDGKLNLDKETYVAFHKLFADLRKEGLVPPAEITATMKQADPKLDIFVNGTVLFLHSAPLSFFPTYDSVSPGKFEITAAPSGKSSGTILNATQYFTVSSNSKNIEQAKKFIDYFINDKEAGLALAFQRGIPVNPNVLKELVPIASEAAKVQIKAMDKFAKTANSVSVRPIGFGSFSDEFDKTQQEVAFGTITAEKAYDNLVKKYNEVVKN